MHGQKKEKKNWDLLLMLKKDSPKIIVIGGGATGCGVARDLVLRGYNTTLIEFGDLGSGTSSRFHGMLQSGARYVVSDTLYAAECYKERVIINKIAPEAVELVGGLFVSLENDDLDYPDEFVKCCNKAEIPCEELDIKDVLNTEKELTANISRAFSVPDAMVNSWKLVDMLSKDILSHGGQVLTGHQVTAINQSNGSINSVEVLDKNGIKKNIECDGIINAAGPWSGRIAALAQQEVELQLTKGSIMVFSHRIVGQAINRCRMPSSNDIMCPSGTVSLWGTTSEVVNDPNTTIARPEEIQELLTGAEELFPKIKSYRAFRSWAGVRPLVKPKNHSSDLPLPRSHVVINHELDGIKNFLTVCGGSLTTHRSMAEDVVNQLGNKFGVNAPCVTHITPIKDSKEMNWTPTLNFVRTENEKKHQELICECELVTRGDIEKLIDEEDITDFHDIRRRTRVGFGPCQGTFCNSRLAEIVSKKSNLANFKESMISFCTERLKGSIKTSYGDQAKQILLNDYVLRENFGLDLNEENSEKEDIRS